MAAHYTPFSYHKSFSEVSVQQHILLAEPYNGRAKPSLCCVLCVGVFTAEQASLKPECLACQNAIVKVFRVHALHDDGKLDYSNSEGQPLEEGL